MPLFKEKNILIQFITSYLEFLFCVYVRVRLVSCIQFFVLFAVTVFA